MISYKNRLRKYEDMKEDNEIKGVISHHIWLKVAEVWSLNLGARENMGQL